MKIRITRFTQAGQVHLETGQVLDLPDGLAQQHIRDGNAAAVPSAEAAIMRRYETPTALPLPSAYRKSAKGRR